MPRYEIIYDYEDEHNITEIFEGDWTELQDYIKQLRATRCYHINAASLDG